MKLNLINRGRAGRALLALAGAAGLWAGGATPAVAQQFQSPAGTWDFVESGSRSGLAYITFADDFTFTGYEIIVPKRGSSQIGDARNDGGDSTRTGTTQPPGTTNEITAVFGFEMISGPWGYDSKGRVIGVFQENIQGTCITNIAVTSSTVTNGDSTVTTYSTNVVINCTSVTNGVSFTGKVTANKRFTLVSTTGAGKVTYRGLPFVSLPDLTGPWYGTKFQAKQTFTEFFNLVPTDLMPNSYFVSGIGPDYSYQDGVVLLSSQKKIGFVANTGGDNGVLRSTIGSFNSKKSTSLMKGVESAAGPLTNFISFQIFKQPVAP